MSSKRQALFNEVFQTEFSYLCRTLRRLGVLEAELDDVAQEVFVSVYRHLDEYDVDRPLRPWLFSFAFRHAANHRRLARHRREKASSDQESQSHRPSPEEDLQRSEDRALILEALNQVKLERRAILIMHDIDGFSVPEIAETLEVNPNTVYSRLRLARHDLEKAVRKIQFGREVR